ncbi:MAG: NADH-quinone oxidoreductase subunit L [Desulfomonile tiedjei]|uniref:NADH-quinone oxidoreductase subunit L n=1 Tax=Desulfomonile tiedjei TaxID=2358 RepID=A0A9D6VBF1_9BACT|nr:NADH-quinone oxidoreductase subunit L [Desulfomonile tiedjei]
MIELVWLIPVFPFIGFLINGLFGRNFPEKVIGWIGALSVGASFVVALGIFLELLGMPAAQRSVQKIVFTWILSGDLNVPIGFLVDPLSMVMLLVVTGVGCLIHIYSIGYMHGELGFRRFFAYLNLFVFNMLILVAANNFLLMFVGWEGVGLCSYLLIGYYYEKQSAADAGKKAFVVNRVGDFGFLIGMFLIFVTFGSLNYLDVFPAAQEKLTQGGLMVTLITLLLFVGATGKSAQIPLYTWLPDAMEGPTPVSALIHAATMVTAGVYMVSRCSVFYAMAPVSMTTVAVIGGATALFAATMGITQFDIKRVLAYSTISQLGYMFMACGVGAFASGIFHLMTHAFFKALLFLSAGSVMHAMSGELDMRKMGALSKKIPITCTVYWFGTLAIAGIVPFAGFFSKDEILFFALVRNPAFWVLGAVAAVMTSFYMFRSLYMTFYGESRVDHETAHHVHESPPLMTVPLMVLAALSLVGGFVGVPIFEGWHRFGDFLAPVFAPAKAILEHGHHAEHHSVTMEVVLMAVSVGIAVLGWLFARWMYVTNPSASDKAVEKFGSVHTLVYNKYWMDEIYDALFVNSIVNFSKLLWKYFDEGIIDAIVNGVGSVTRGIGELLRWLQTGLVKDYAYSILLGVLVVIGYLVLK